MLRKYKNQFLKIIIAYGFDPKDFKGEEGIVHKYPAFILTYKATPLVFIATNSKQDHHHFDYNYVQFNHEFTQTGYAPKDEWMDSKSMFKEFANWLKKHVREYCNEIETPDMWDQVEKSKTIIHAFSGGEDDKSLFSDKDKKEVCNALNSFKEQAREQLDLSDSQASFLNDKIDYLAGSVDRLTKFDWKNVAVATIISASVALSLDVEKGRLLFNLFKEAFKFTLKLISS